MNKRGKGPGLKKRLQRKNGKQTRGGASASRINLNARDGQKDEGLRNESLDRHIQDSEELETSGQKNGNKKENCRPCAAWGGGGFQALNQ